MKKLIFASIALLAFGFTNAQTARFGIKGGLNVSTLSGDVDDASPKIGAHIGGLVEIKIARRFSIQPELLLSLQGAKSEYSYSEPGYSESSESKIHLTYLNIPVMAKFYVVPKLSLEAGPQIGFLVGAKNKYSETIINGGEVSSYSQTVSSKSGLATVDAAFNIGASYYLTDNMFLQGRFCIGITSIDGDRGFYRSNNGNGNDNYYYVSNDITNNVFQLSFGYRF